MQNTDPLKALEVIRVALSKQPNNAAHKALKCADRYHRALLTAKRQLASSQINQREYAAIVRAEKDKILATMLE